jgi:hypothetical protein
MTDLHLRQKHRTGSYEPPRRRCLTPAEMKAKGMLLNEAGFWITKLREDMRFSLPRDSRIDSDGVGKG